LNGDLELKQKIQNKNIIANLFCLIQAEVVLPYKQVYRDTTKKEELISKYDSLHKCFKIALLDHNQEFCAKLIIEDELELSMTEFLYELSILSFVEHVNIMKAIGVLSENELLPRFEAKGIVMHFYSKDLSLYLDLAHGLTLKNQLALAIGIAKGMQFLHSLGIYHRDLKSKNIMLDQKRDYVRPIITDFGTSRPITNRPMSHQRVGTTLYMAPEVFDHKPFTSKGDVYSFGVLLAEICIDSSIRNFSRIDFSEFRNRKIKTHQLSDVCTKPPGDLLELILSCTTTNPDKRPEFQEIMALLTKLVHLSFDDYSKDRETLELVINEIDVGGSEEESIEIEISDKPKKDSPLLK